MIAFPMFYRSASAVISAISIAPRPIECIDAKTATGIAVAAMHEKHVLPTNRTDRPDSVLQIPLLDGHLVAASWGGPDEGALVFVRCDGSPGAAASTGNVLSLRALSRRGDRTRQLAIARVIAGTGTGWYRVDEVIFNISRDGLTRVWSATTYERSTVSESVGAYEVVATVTVARDSAVVVGRRTPLIHEQQGNGWIADTRRRKAFHVEIKLPPPS